jgi:predicted Zn-dependent peptidase
MRRIAFISGFILVYFTAIFAQQIPELPIDPDIRYGKLDNGLTYYIRHNELPKERADFFIARNVGAILEEDDQNGLAHFLEHMAFNGSTHFPGNSLINYLESIGVKFGQNMLQQILRIVYTEKVREDEGGTYGVSVSSSISDYPAGQTPLQIYYETEPGKAAYLNEIVKKVFQQIVTDGPRQEDFTKVKEFMLKRQQEQEQENSYWTSTIIHYYRTGYNAYSDYVKTLNEITPAEIQQIAQSFIDSKNIIEVVMTRVKED